MNLKTDILMFVEDPGAANMVLDLPSLLANQGCKVVLLAMSHAARYLKARHATFSVIPEDAGAIELLTAYDPCLIVVGTSENPDSLSFELIHSARRKSIMTFGLVDMSCNADLRFRGRGDQALNHAPDRLIVPDNITRDAFVHLGYPVKNISNLGNPQYDKAWRRRDELEQLGASRQRERPCWVFVAEGFDQLNPAASLRSSDYSLFGRGKTDWRTGIVLEEILDGIAELSPRPEIIVRPHPKSSSRDFQPWESEIIIDDIVDPMESVWRADAVLGMSSMLLLESAILGRPVLSVLPRRHEREWLGPLASLQVASVYDRDDLRLALVGLLTGCCPSAPPESWATPNAAKRIASYLVSMTRK